MAFNLSELQQKVDRVIHNADEFIRRWIEFMTAPAGSVTIEYYDAHGNLITKTFANKNKLVQDFITNFKNVTARTVFVDPAATGDGDGSPDNPYKYLSTALANIPPSTFANIILLNNLELANEPLTYLPLESKFINLYLNGYTLSKTNTNKRFNANAFCFVKIWAVCPPWLPAEAKNLDSTGNPVEGKIRIDNSNFTGSIYEKTLFTLADAFPVIILGDWDSNLTIETDAHVVVTARGGIAGEAIKCNVVPINGVTDQIYIFYSDSAREIPKTVYAKSSTLPPPVAETNIWDDIDRHRETSILTAYIHVNGDDRIAEFGNQTKPFRTIHQIIKRAPRFSQIIVTLLSDYIFDPLDNNYALGLEIDNKYLIINLNGFNFTVKGLYDENRGKILYHNFLLENSIVRIDDGKVGGKLILEGASQVNRVLQSGGTLVEALPPAGATFGTNGLSSVFTPINSTENQVVLYCSVDIPADAGVLAVTGNGEWGGIVNLQIGNQGTRKITIDAPLLYNVQGGGNGWGSIYINTVSNIQKSNGTPYNDTVGDTMYWGSLIGGVVYSPTEKHALNVRSKPVLYTL